tara:strand:- start:353 stop:1000 length:648 start_codon:yes stop_codon:yes gene_type:complete
MAWPSGTKASTSNCDAGTDQISLARADIKQNIDNVNSIIDEFNISSPSNGDLLQYSTSSGKWEQVATTSVGSQSKLALLDFRAENLSQGTFSVTSADALTAGQVTELADPDGLVSVSGDSASAYTITLSAGKYLIDLMYDGSTPNTFDFRIEWKDHDSGTDWEHTVTASDTKDVFKSKYFDTSVYSTNLQTRLGWYNNIVSDKQFDGIIKITKVG